MGVAVQAASGAFGPRNQSRPRGLLVVSHQQVVGEKSRNPNVLQKTRALAPQAHLQAEHRSPLLQLAALVAELTQVINERPLALLLQTCPRTGGPVETVDVQASRWAQLCEASGTPLHSRPTIQCTFNHHRPLAMVVVEECPQALRAVEAQAINLQDVWEVLRRSPPSLRLRDHPCRHGGSQRCPSKDMPSNGLRVLRCGQSRGPTRA
mmetsp:Transcript_106286/g.285933  ORF Transcript_106286/g.285933 Transcript_106286/m.285933 type:complete len:208 (+) Transcript_106286:829-1452(+)